MDEANPKIGCRAGPCPDNACGHDYNLDDADDAYDAYDAEEHDDGEAVY